MTTNEINTPARQTAIHGLAVIGFITLIVLGVSLAVYSARYFPNIVDRLGVASVSLSEVFTPATKPSLAVVPTASTTTSLGGATSTTTATSTLARAPKKEVNVAPTMGEKKSETYQIGGTASAPTLFGLPDFEVTINAVGYFTSNSPDSFVASSVVPTGLRPAVYFVVKNVGTNATGVWHLTASVPAQAAYSKEWKEFQASLNPGEYTQYFISFDYFAATKGQDQMISVTANFDRAVVESNLDNNNASAKITILGS